MVEAEHVRLSLSSYHVPGSWPGGQYLGLVAPLPPWYQGHALSAGVFGDWAGGQDGFNPAFDTRGLERTYQVGYAIRMPPSLPLTHQLAAGVNGFWHQFARGAGARELDWGLDVGLHWNPLYSSRFGELYVDAALLNALSPYRADSAAGGRPPALPRDFNGSMLWRSPLRDLDLHAGLLIQDVDREIAERGYRPGGGVTWHPKRDWELELRYNPLGFPEAGGAYRLYREGWMPILEGRSRLSYGMVQVGFAASLFARKDTWMAPVQHRRVRRYYDSYPPVESMREARRLYAARRYDLAATMYGRILAYHPDYLFGDSTAFEFGVSLGKLGFHALSREVFRDNLKRYSDGNHTRLIADNMHELVRLDYLVGEYDTALARDSLFQVRFPGSPFAPTFAFFKAQICFLRGQYAEAIPLYAGVPAEHFRHPEARHNLAICQLRTGDARAAVATFATLMDSPLDSVGADIRESATVKTGMILRGLKDPRADTILAEIGPASAYYDEALLARAWSAIRQGDFPRAETLSDSLLVGQGRSPLAKEACFLKALAAFRQGRDEEALRLADSVVAGEWPGFLLPEERETIERAEAEAAAYDNLQMAFYGQAIGIPRGEVDRYIGCRPSIKGRLEEYRQLRLRASVYRKREAKTARYAQSRKEATAMAARLRGILQPRLEAGTGP